MSNYENLTRDTWTRGTLTNDVAKRHVIRKPELIARLHKLAVPTTAWHRDIVTQDTPTSWRTGHFCFYSHGEGSHPHGQGAGHAEARPARREPERGVCARGGHHPQRRGRGGLAQVPGEAGVVPGDNMMGPESQRAVTVPLQQLGQRHHVHEVVIVEVAPPLLVRLQEIFELLLHLAAQGQPGPRVDRGQCVGGTELVLQFWNKSIYIDIHNLKFFV